MCKLVWGKADATKIYQDYLPGGLNSITTGAAFLAGGASNSFFGEIWVKRDLDLVVGVS